MHEKAKKNKLAAIADFPVSSLRKVEEVSDSTFSLHVLSYKPFVCYAPGPVRLFTALANAGNNVAENMKETAR